MTEPRIVLTDQVYVMTAQPASTNCTIYNKFNNKMNKDQIFECIDNICRREYKERYVGDYAEFDYKTDLYKDVGLDSIDIVELLEQLSNYFEVKLHYAELNGNYTLDNIVNLVYDKLYN